MKLRETNTWSGSNIEEGVLKNVKILGSVSRNGNLYPEATRTKAHKFLEGIHVNLNHLTKGGSEHSVEKRIGKLVNIHEKEDGSYGDFHFLTTHPFTPTLMEAAEKMPDLYGFSINGTGTGKKHDGKFIVESIDSLRSVDLVADAGTTKTLFEGNMEEEVKTCEVIMGELIAMMVSEGKEEYVKDAIKLKKKMMGDKEEEEVPAEEKESDEMVAAEESWKQEYKTLKLEKTCRNLLEQAHVPVEETLLETLTALPDDEARNKFISWQKKKSVVKQTKSSDTIKLTESVSPVDYAKILRSK